MRVRAWHGAVVVLGVVVGLVVVAYVRGPADPVVVTATATKPAPSPSSSSFGVVQIAGLVPAEPAASEWEDTEAVQAIRQYETVIRWASLIGDFRFQQFQDIVDPSHSGKGAGFVSATSALVGPMPVTPTSVSDEADGTTVVGGCTLFTWRLSVDRQTGARAAGGREAHERVRYVLSPLTTQEQGLLDDRAASYTSLRVREFTYVKDEQGVTATCPEVPVVLQEFEDWQQHLVSAVDG